MSQSRVDQRPRPTTLDSTRLADDLAGVERALERLEDGSYWTDEVTGEPIRDELLEADPTARRRPGDPRRTMKPERAASPRSSPAVSAPAPRRRCCGARSPRSRAGARGGCGS